MGAIVRRAGIAESVRRTGVSMKLMNLAEFCELRVEPAHIVGRWILVVGAEVPLNRAMDLARAVERRRTFTERDHCAAAVEHHAGG